MRRILREAKKVAAQRGFEYGGIRGNGHYFFERGDKTITIASTPTNLTETLNRFERDIRKYGSNC